jgi:hypothetical protein
MSAPGTYRTSDGSAIQFSAAVEKWAEAAHEGLIETARSYKRVITYKHLAELAQERSGIRTNMLMMHWIGQVLEGVAIESSRRNEPMLTALCVHHDGTIGDGYAKAVRIHHQEPDADLESQAAVARLDCYRRYATDLPTNGGNAFLTPQVAARRAVARTRTQPPTEASLCPTCRMELPVTRRCDQCD